MKGKKAAGLDVPEHRLFNNKYFGVKRFDRKPDGGKVFMISASGLFESSHRLPALDYTDLINVTLQLTRDYRQAEKMFRLMCFNVFTHNRDDHSKNFSFLYDDGKWSVSPVYDLVYMDGLGGEHATSIDGEGRNPMIADLERVAMKTGVGRVNFGSTNIINKVKTAVDKSRLLKKYKK